MLTRSIISSASQISNERDMNVVAVITKRSSADRKPDRVCSPAEKPTEHRNEITDDMEVQLVQARLKAHGHVVIQVFKASNELRKRKKLMGSRPTVAVFAATLRLLFQGDTFSCNWMRQKLTKEGFINQFYRHVSTYANFLFATQTFCHERLT